MIIVLSEPEKKMALYIAEHEPKKSKFVTEYAKAMKMQRGHAKAILDRLIKHGVVTWYTFSVPNDATYGLDHTHGWTKELAGAGQKVIGAENGDGGAF